MNGILKKTATFLLGIVLVAPFAGAQQRTSGHRNSSKSEQVSSTRGNRGGESHNKSQASPSAFRPTAATRPSNASSHSINHGTMNNGSRTKGDLSRLMGNRPGNNGGNQITGNRSGNNGGNPGNLFGGNGNQTPGNRPGNNGVNPGNPLGGNGNQTTGNRPSNNPAPVVGNRPVTGVRPGSNYRPPFVQHAPIHIHRPVVSTPWRRPVPPAAWRPRVGAPSISAIFGINFGAALNVSLNFLLGNGYTVSSYGGNAVYLSDVDQYNYYWPEATMYYGSNGLERTEFFFSTSYPDTVRYNSLYNTFTATYGAPVDVSNVASSLSATWFAPNKGYIKLQYTPQYSSGQLRFYTTVTTGL